MKSVKPKKFLGQHFLKDLQVAQDIANTVDACPELPILEVGPGMGVLTQFLMTKERPLKVVELDFESVAYLRENFPALGNNIIEQDFLKMDLAQLFEGKPFVLTGNYPYNITSHGSWSRQQDLWYPERTDTGLVPGGISVYSPRTCFQSASQSEKCSHPHDTQRDSGTGMQ